MLIEMQAVKTGLIRFPYEDPVGNCTRGHSCYIQAKNLSTFSLCSETLDEAELKMISKLTWQKKF
jgi:hypothetical protein